METCLKTGFAQIFSCCPKKLSCPKFGGAAAPLAPPARTPMHDERQFDFFAFVCIAKLIVLQSSYVAQYPATTITT